MELIDKYFPVLDYGFVALKDVMGDDQAIEQAARVSYGAGTRKKSETRGLLRYLLRHKHTTPFEMVEFKFHCAMPLFVARQWIRHRTASVNEYSGRYSLMPNLYYTPDKWCEQATDNKQGTDRTKDVFDEHYKGGFQEWATGHAHEVRKDLTNRYKTLVSKNVSRELARIDLPLSTYTYWYWKIDLHNLFNFLRLRCDSHAQWEIRAFANVMAGMVKEVCPLAFEAWYDYVFQARNWTRLDQEMMAEYISRVQGDDHNIEEKIEKFALALGASKREVDEFWEKITPRTPVDFTLDMDQAKDAKYFEKIIKEHSPCVKNTSSS